MTGILDKDKLPNEGLKKLAEEAAIMAQIIGMQNVGQNNGEETQPGGEQSPMGGPEGIPTEPEGLDNQGTGGGTIGTGNVPMPGENEFAG